MRPPYPTGYSEVYVRLDLPSTQPFYPQPAQVDVLFTKISFLELRLRVGVRVKANRTQRYYYALAFCRGYVGGYSYVAEWGNSITARSEEII